MPLPKVLVPLIDRREFWTDFFFGDWYDGNHRGWNPDEDREYPELGRCDVRLWFTDDCALVLELDSLLCQPRLSLLTPALQTPDPIAWDDMAHWHTYVMRWEELDLICRCVAVLDSSLPHPGIPLLLLHRFAPLCRGDDPIPRSHALRAAWRALGIFTEEEVDRFTRRFDLREQGLRWVVDERLGWILSLDKRSHSSDTMNLTKNKVLIQDNSTLSFMPIYSTRQPGGDFPFEHFADAIEGAKVLYNKVLVYENGAEQPNRTSSEK